MPEESFEYAYEAIGNLLIEQGVTDFFTLMSDGTIGLVTDLVSNYESDIDLYYTRHESGAVSMADGYSRATGNIGVCAIGRGPALTNAMTSLLTARKKGSNVLLIAPKRPHFRYYDNPSKRVDQNALLQTAVGGSDMDRNRFGYSDRVVDVDTHDTLYSDLEEIFRRLRAGEGPIAVQIPTDVLNEKGEIPRPDDSRGTDPSTSPRGVLTPSGRQVDAAVDLYRDTDAGRPPVVIAGQGAVAADAKEEILRFAERTNAMLATTMQSRGFFSGHPYSVGEVGGFGTDLANEYTAESDFVLAVGCSLNRHQTDGNEIFGEGEHRSKIVHVDTDVHSLGRYAPVDVAIHGDAEATLESINRKLEALSVDRGEEFWNDRTRTRVEEAKARVGAAEMDGDRNRLNPRHVLSKLNDVIPEDRIVLHDTGDHQFWVLDEMDVTDPGDFIWTKDFGAVGESLTLGIGAALDESRTCVTFCGDAGFMMSLQELETAVRHDIPVVVVVLNNRALGAEYTRIVRNELPTDGSAIETPDLGTVADSLGADGYTITDPDDLASVEDVLTGPIDGPIVINCEIPRDLLSPRSPSA